MKIIKRILLGVLVILILIVLGLYVTGNTYLFKGLQETYLKGYTTANIDDHSGFDNNVVASSGQPQKWQKHKEFEKIELTDTLRHELEKFQSAAFVIIHQNKLLFEEYWLGYNDTSKTNSFSMAKTVVTMLLGAAIEDGHIESLNQPITDFLPEFKDNDFAQRTTVGDLSAMTAGYNWEEDYWFPIHHMAKAYYTTKLEEQVLSRDFIRESGEEFEYLSGVTQLLGVVLKRATNQSLSKYLSDKFWKPMGMEQDALWSLDRKDGIEKAYCCLNSNAKDFAKLGQFLLQNGNWNGKQLLSASFVEKMVTPNYKAFKEGAPAKYGYSVWTDYDHNPKFYAFLGHLGQRIIVIPSLETVIVRLGREKDVRALNLGPLPGTDIYYYVDEVVKMIQSLPKSEMKSEPVLEEELLTEE